MKKAAVLFWTDVVLAGLMVALLGTGVVIRWVLPPGSGGGGGHGRGHGAARMLLDLTRHEWGDVHFWIAVTLVAGVLIHLVLHWAWVKASVPRYVLGR